MATATFRGLWLQKPAIVHEISQARYVLRPMVIANNHSPRNFPAAKCPPLFGIDIAALSPTATISSRHHLSRKAQTMASVHVIDHPLIEAKLTHMRDRDTTSPEFRALLKEISILMGYEITRDFPTKLREVDTPICRAAFPVLKDDFFTIVPILRAGLGMVDGLLELMPFAHVGHIGLVRNEQTHLPEEYYYKMPEGYESSVIMVVDPMLATGGSMELGLKAFETKGIPGKVHLCSAIASRKGVDYLTETFKDTDYTLWCGAIDPELNDHMYIVPGLGDAGDLAYGGKL